MEKGKKAGINKKLLVLIIILAIILGAALYALSFYGDVSDPESLFDEPMPSTSPAVEATPAPTAQPTPTPDPDKILSAQADQEFMSKRTNILVLGIDESAEREDWGSFRTDTILLVSVDFSANDVCMVSIPRDSYVKLYNSAGELVDPENPYDKINSAFSDGGGAQKKGFEYTMTTIEKLMGVNVDYYCAFNMNVVKEVVDAMGGVDYEVDVEVSMNGRTLSPGFQHLDGQGVLDYCRQRKGSSDIARIDRQQRMLAAILEQLKSTHQIANLPAIYIAVQDNIMTNLSFRQITSLSLVALRMDMSQLSRHTVEGKALDIYGRSCWCIRAAELEELVDDIWGKKVTVDPEIDYDYIVAQLELNRQLIASELNRGILAYNKAYTLLHDYKNVMDDDSYDTLKAYAKALEDAIDTESKEELDMYTPPVEQLCYSICNQYGIQLY